MSLVAINWKPTDRQLRQFAVATFVALPMLAWIWSHGNTAVVSILAVGGAVVAMIGWLSPRTIRPLFLAVTLVMFPVGIVMSELVLAMVFFGVFLTVGLVFRLIGRDAMTRRWDCDARTYWSEKSMPKERDSYFYQW